MAPATALVVYNVTCKQKNVSIAVHMQEHACIESHKIPLYVHVKSFCDI